MQRWLGAGNAVASGVMLGASAGLVIEGIHRDALRTAIGALAGVGFAYLAYTLHRPAREPANGRPARSRTPETQSSSSAS